MVAAVRASCRPVAGGNRRVPRECGCRSPGRAAPPSRRPSPSLRRRSEEHTSELQSQSNLVCRLLLEKKKKQNKYSQVNKPTDHPQDQSYSVLNNNSQLLYRVHFLIFLLQRPHASLRHSYISFTSSPH